MTMQEHVKRVRDALDSRIDCEIYQNAVESIDAIERALALPDDLRKLAEDYASRCGWKHISGARLCYEEDLVKAFEDALQRAYTLGKDSK